MVDLILWIFFFFPRFLIQLFKKKKYVGKATSVAQTTNDIKYKSVMICKYCGNIWHNG